MLKRFSILQILIAIIALIIFSILIRELDEKYGKNKVEFLDDFRCISCNMKTDEFCKIKFNSPLVNSPNNIKPFYINTIDCKSNKPELIFFSSYLQNKYLKKSFVNFDEANSILLIRKYSSSPDNSPIYSNEYIDKSGNVKGYAFRKRLEVLFVNKSNLKVFKRKIIPYEGVAPSNIYSGGKVEFGDFPSIDVINFIKNTFNQ